MKRTEDDVLKLIQEELQLQSISQDAAMQKTRNWDSMGQVGLMLKLEEELGIKIPPDEFGKLISVKEILAFLREEGILADG